MLGYFSPKLDRQGQRSIYKGKKTEKLHYLRKCFMFEKKNVMPHMFKYKICDDIITHDIECN